MTWGGRILLNGTGTKKHPYDCDVGNNTGIYINKSVTIEGVYLKPYVSCYDGIHFGVSSDEPQKLSIVLSGIAFSLTTLTFDDCYNVKLVNCFFHNASTALMIQVQNRMVFELDIQCSAFLYNDLLCIKLVLEGNATSQSLRLSVKVLDTYFMRNGLQSTRLSENGIIKIIAKPEDVPNSTQISAFFQNVTCTKNYGFFMNLNVPSATTNETYNDVRLHRNNLPLSCKMSRKFCVDSLYYSVTRETRVRFINLQCIQNRMYRCIAIQSEKADVEILDSKFIGQFVNYFNLNKGAGLFLLANNSSSLNVVNTNFTTNKAIVGGALFANSPNGTLSANFTKVNFKRCSAVKTGGAISVGKPPLPGHRNGMCPSTLHLTITKVNIEDCRGQFHRCNIVYVCFKSGAMSIQDSKWVNNLRKTSSALYVNKEPLNSEAAVTISRCSFKDNEGSGISMSTRHSNGGNATIVDTLLVNNKKRQKTALSISPGYRIELLNISVMFFHYGLKTIERAPGHNVHPVDIIVANCTFTNNIYDMLFSLRDPTSVQLIIKNTIFTSNEILQRSYAIRFHIPPLKKLNISEAVIGLHNNTFDSRPSSNFALFFHGNKTLWIRRSTFKNCVCLYREKWAMPGHGSADRSFYETATGALSIITNLDTPLQSGCVPKDAINDTHPLWAYNSHVVIENTLFQDNTGLIAGGVSLSNGNATFHKCVFQDNFAIEQTGHVYSAYGTGQVNFKDCSFLRTKKSVKLKNRTFNKGKFLYSESGGPLRFENTSMISFVAAWNSYPVFHISSGGYVVMDNDTTIHCCRGSKLLLENTTHFSLSESRNNFCKINVTSLTFSCRSCAPGYYSLQKGRSRGLAVEDNVFCYECPFGANCHSGIIAAEANFWGYQTSQNPQKLEFIPCPDDYCQSPARGSIEYNDCVGNRTSTLCGACAPGYSETLLSTECLPRDKCDNKWYWVVTALATTGLAIYLLIKPPIFKFLKKQILWFRKREHEQARDDFGDVCEHSDSGYIKIIFYFYQAAELLTVGSTDELLHKVTFISVVKAGFNFRLHVFTEKVGCPFVGLTAVTKELVLSGTVFATMAEVLIIYCIHFGFSIVRQKATPSPQLYVAAIVEIMLLGYERLSETSFKLLQCVPIGSEKRLFLDGSLVCWQWWQYALLAYVIVFVVPFFFVLYFGSFKLYRGLVPTSEFLGACIIPLPFLIYWFIKHLLKNSEDNYLTIARMRAENEHVLEVLQGPFRPPNDQYNGTLYWESVLIGRRFILLACEAFIEDEMLCLVVMTASCVLMLLHHVWKSPYRDPIANSTETVSLLALVIIALINVPKATLLSFGTGLNGPSKSYLKAMEWVEVCTLVFFPLWLSLCVVLAIFSQLIRLMAFVVMQIFRCLRRTSTWNMVQLSRPLLSISDSDSDIDS